MQSPGNIEEHRESRLRRDKGHRGPFLWFVSLGKQRNEQKDFIATLPGIPGKTFFKPPKATAFFASPFDKGEKYNASNTTGAKIKQA